VRVSRGVDNNRKQLQNNSIFFDARVCNTSLWVRLQCRTVTINQSTNNNNNVSLDEDKEKMHYFW